MRCGILLLLLAVISTGCISTRPDDPKRTIEEILALADFYQPYLLYQKAPLTQLYVEVDAMESAIPKQEWLDTLKTFLEQVVDQPVIIERGDVLTKDQSRGRSSTSLALEHMDGPPDETSAYMYVHYFDSRLLTDRKTDPRAMLVPHPASIAIDCRYSPPGIGTVDRINGLFLMHEAAHLLGLARNSQHGDGLHCTNQYCLLNASIEFDQWQFLLGRDAWKQKSCCADCLADLLAYRSLPAPDNLRFLGPYFVRSEIDYHVLTLPGLVYIHVGDIADLDHAHLADHRRETVAFIKKSSDLKAITSEMDLDTAARLIPLLRKDPYTMIHPVADNLEQALKEASASNEPRE